VELIRHLKPKKAYFTHISHQMGLHQTIQSDLPDGIFLAYDGLQIRMD
jgi:phosphoribosyl 1,2-cyclic phosphate phosphodiesterase